MFHPRFSKQVIFAAFLVTHSMLITSSIAYGQSVQDPGPITLKVCEQGVDDCSIWVLQRNGHLGSGLLKTGGAVSLSYTVTGAAIVIERFDPTNTTVKYTGTIDKDGLSGTFEQLLPGQSNSRTGHWFASVVPPVSIPTVIHFCGATVSHSHGAITTTQSRLRNPRVLLAFGELSRLPVLQ